MIVEIKEDVFKCADFKGLNYLIQILTYKQRYKLFVELTLIKDTEYFDKIDIDDKKEIEVNYDIIIQSGEEPKPSYFVSENNVKNNFFNIDEAIRFFSQPVSIILENSLNDQYFLTAIINNFDKKGEVKRHFNNAWIQFENAGGCGNFINFITAKLQSFNNFSKNNKSQYLRCFVLLDSDKKYSEMPLEQGRLNLKFFLDKNNISHHILEKREMENYIPEFILSSFNDNYLNLYIKLSSPEQKDFFDLEKGFNKNRSDRNCDSNILKLYESVSNDDWNVLKNGIKISPYDKQFKSEFPKLFIDSSVDLKSLQARCGTNELKEILDKIEALL